MAKRAIFLVRDVSAIAAFGEALAQTYGFELAGNEATANALAEKGVACERVDPEEARSQIENPSRGVVLLVANFVDVETAGRGFLSWKSALSAFDRGIVEAIRKAAWQPDRVAVLGNPADYENALAELEANDGKFRQGFRMERATAALRAASEFEFAVAQYLEVQGADAPDMGALSGYSKAMRFAWPRATLLDTGENRHQRAGLYGSFWEHFEQVAGVAVDYWSVMTVSRAAYLIGEFEKPAAALLRNGRIVTAVCSSDGSEGLQRLLDHEDAADCWLVVNGSVGEENLDTVFQSGIAGILAPDFSEKETALLKQSGSQIKAIVSKSGLGYEALQEVRSVVGGALIQDKDRAAINPMEWTVASLSQPLVDDWESLMFAAKMARHVESAALVVVTGERVVALEGGLYSSGKAWSRVLETGIGLANTIAVFDEAEVDASVLAEMKQQGVRVVLLPAGSKLESQREAANACGLVLLTMGKSLRRF